MFIALFPSIFPVDFKVVFNSFRVTRNDSPFAFFPIVTFESGVKGLKKNVPEKMSLISVLAYY